MIQSEFIEIHGQEAWNKLVVPRQNEDWPQVIKNDAVDVAHISIYFWLIGQGLDTFSLLHAQELYEKQHQPGLPTWPELLATTLFHSEILEERRLRAKQNFEPEKQVA